MIYRTVWNGSKYGLMEDLCSGGDNISSFTSCNFLIYALNYLLEEGFVPSKYVDVSALSAEALPLIIMERSHDLFLTPGTVHFVKGHDLSQRAINNVRKCDRVRHCPAYSGGHTTYRNKCRILILKKEAENGAEISGRYPENVRLYVHTKNR